MCGSSTLTATSSTQLRLANLQRFELLAELVGLSFELIRNRVVVSVGHTFVVEVGYAHAAI